MKLTFAQLEDGICINLAKVPKGRVSKWLDNVDGTWLDVTGGDVRPGDTYDGNVWVRPPRPVIEPEARILKAAEFAELFTPTEFAAITQLRQTHPVIMQAWYVAEMQGTVNMGSPKLDAVLLVISQQYPAFDSQRIAEVKAAIPV